MDPDTAKAETFSLALGFHEVRVPSVPIAARFWRAVEPIVVNDPPMKTVEPEIARAETLGMLPPTFGSHEVRVPSVPIAAKQFLVVEPTVLKEPPTYTVDPDTASVLTLTIEPLVAPRFGFHDVGVEDGIPVVPSILNAARPLRVFVPPTVLK